MAKAFEGIEFLNSESEGKAFLFLEPDENAGKECWVELAPQDPDEIYRLTKLCTKKGKFDRKTGKREEMFEEDRFEKKFSEKFIKGWTGLTVEGLTNIAAVKVVNRKPEDEIPFTENDAYFLMSHSKIFSAWVMDTTGDASNFAQIEDGELDENFIATSKPKPVRNREN